MAKRLTLFILAGMILGIVVGYGMNRAIADPVQLKAAADYFTIATDIFLHLIKMIIAPLVFSTLVVGIAHMGDTAALGRIGLRTLLWFIAASLVSLSLGLVLVNLFQPGSGLGLPLPPVSESANLAKAGFNLHDFLVHLVPTSAIEAMAKNDILPLVIFSLFVGVALTAIGEKGAPLVRGIESLVYVMLQVTNYVMLAAPVAVFAAIAHAVAVNGLAILGTYAKFVGSFYLGLALLWAILIGAGWLFLRGRTFLLVRYIRDPILLAFSTASSESAYPRLLEALDRFGVPRRISSFILPLGYSFNLDGSMMYMTYGAMFIAQAYGIHISIGQQILMVLMLMVTSKGMAGVPRASLVVIAAIVPHFGIPEAGLLLVLAVDQFMDMGRTGTNVVGNAVATAVITKWEGKLEVLESDLIEPLPAPAHTPHDGARGLELDPRA